MKKLFLISSLLIGLSTSAQFSLGYYGLHNIHSDLNKGWGFGMNGLSSSLLKEFPVQLQIGGGYNLLWAGNESFSNVVLTDGGPSLDVTFTNMQVALLSTIRVGIPSMNKRFTPYAEISPGWGSNSAIVNIHDENNPDNCIDYSASRTSAFSIIAATGLQVKLSDNFAVDAAMTWDKNYNRGNMINMQSIDLSDGVNYNLTASPSTVVCFRIGIRAFLSRSYDDNGCCSYSGCTVKHHHKSCGNTHLPHR